MSDIEILGIGADEDEPMAAYRAGSVPLIAVLDSTGRVLYSRLGALEDRAAVSRARRYGGKGAGTQYRPSCFTLRPQEAEDAYRSIQTVQGADRAGVRRRAHIRREPDGVGEREPKLLRHTAEHMQQQYRLR